MTIELRGMEQLLSELSRLENPKYLEKKALEAAAEHLRSKIEENAPNKTGFLKERIEKSEVKNGEIEVGPGKDAFYGHFLEFGTSKMSARPFIAPTFEKEKSAIERKMADEIRKGLRL